MTELAVPRPLAGETFGVEEEFHLVDPDTLDLCDGSALSGHDLGPLVQQEIETTQLEAVTSVCRTLDELRTGINPGPRRGSRRRGHGRDRAAAGVHAPLRVVAGLADDEPPRYLELLERWGLLALQQDICGCHVHVSVPDLDAGVAVMDHVRPYLPVVQALTSSSPFHGGLDTGYDSFRTLWFGRWSITGPTETLGDAATYLDVVESLVTAGAIDDASHLYWDVRPSTKYPTLEYRIGDVCTRVDDAVLHAALVRSLTRVLAARATAGAAPADVRPELLRAARWRAARYGVTGPLLDPVRRELVPTFVLVERLLAELRDDLDEHGEREEVEELVARVLRDGTSAVRQRAVLHRTSDLVEVARSVTVDGGL